MGTRTAAVVLAMLLGSCGPDNREAEQGPPGIDWPSTAAAAAKALADRGLSCREEGRELYPVLYACTPEGSAARGSINLYANDRNDLVGIRAFAPAGSADVMRETISLISLPATYAERLTWSGKPGIMRYGDLLIIETGETESVRYLRITPVDHVYIK